MVSVEGGALWALVGRPGSPFPKYPSQLLSGYLQTASGAPVIYSACDSQNHFSKM